MQLEGLGGFVQRHRGEDASPTWLIRRGLGLFGGGQSRADPWQRTCSPVLHSLFRVILIRLVQLFHLGQPTSLKRESTLLQCTRRHKDPCDPLHPSRVCIRRSIVEKRVYVCIGFIFCIIWPYSIYILIYIVCIYNIYRHTCM